MNLDQAKILYRAAGGEEDHSPDVWLDIRNELQLVVDAKTDRGASQYIAWWACWDRTYTATAFARRVRESYKTMMEEQP